MRHPLLLFLLTIAPGAISADEKAPEVRKVRLDELAHPVAEVRIEALRDLQTSLDPRIPEAMLPLLSDGGTSIRRLAARAIGSRWWQIPEDRLPAFVAALRTNERSRRADVKNMTDRALGLLRRDYRGKMFSRSPNKRWVIYERRGLPCLINTRNHSEELLGWTPEHERELFRPRLGAGTFNDTLNEAVLWHPRKELVAFDMVSAGKPRPLAMWVWQHRAGLRKMEYKNIVDGLTYDSKLEGWKGDELRFRLSHGDSTSLIGWDVAKNKLRTISR